MCLLHGSQEYFILIGQQWHSAVRYFGIMMLSCKNVADLENGFCDAGKMGPVDSSHMTFFEQTQILKLINRSAWLMYREPPSLLK